MLSVTNSISGITMDKDAQEATVQSVGAGDLAKILRLIKTNPQGFREDFAPWIGANLHIWTRFELEANRTWDRGRRRYSARTLIEFIRHETSMNEGPDAFYKINNSFVPDISRLYGMLYPERVDFFECRVITACTIRHQIRKPTPIRTSKQPGRRLDAVAQAA